ncbi:MAG TPA: FkbM family methyltransferase [Aliidongia sp.]|nr:FkbM family methyltransferase [Aliidongia sp.]
MITPSTSVIDIGANVGFFTRRFARWVSGGGRVIALEPEPKNFEALVRVIDRRGLSAVVDPVQAAAAETEGTVFLKLNPDNPADHRLAQDGISVPMVTIDGLMAERGWPRVSLIKIDVQGAEFRVLQGAGQTIERSRPTLFIEVDDAHLRLAGCSAEMLLRHIVGLGYSAHLLTRSGLSPVIPVEELLAGLTGSKSYADVLFIPLRPV